MKRLYVFLIFILLAMVILALTPPENVWPMISFYKVVLPIIPLFEASAILHEIGELMLKWRRRGE